jgi:hypothetical protein
VMMENVYVNAADITHVQPLSKLICYTTGTWRQTSINFPTLRFNKYPFTGFRVLYTGGQAGSSRSTEVNFQCQRTGQLH